MTPAGLIDEARRHGARFMVAGERLRVEAPAALPGALLAALRAHKRELLALLATNDAPDPDGIAEWQAERAAIMEYDGGLAREDAEREAYRLTVAWFSNTGRVH